MVTERELSIEEAYSRLTKMPLHRVLFRGNIQP